MLENGAPRGAPIDRYVVQEYLAEGGMGAIYLGKKLGAGGFAKLVVLKQLLPEFTQQPEFIDLFLREARLSATLDHANIIHTIDLVTAGQEYFIVMEFLDGADLRTLLKRAKLRKKRASAKAAIFIGRELLSALNYAHSKHHADGSPLRLIHRDISPSNILISGAGEVKLTDFGIAKASTHNSVFYRVKGKIGYMSPEQAKSEPLDARSDLYSLAVCLYEIITGERLFVAAGLLTSADEMYRQPVPLVSRKVGGLPPELDKVMLKALSVDRDHRYQTAGEFQEALLRVAHRHGLMMSAPELAKHLYHVCGNPENWRDSDMLDDSNIGVGTEIYDEGPEPTGTVRLELDEYDEPGESLTAIMSGEVVDEKLRRGKRALTSLEGLNRLQGLELTSFVPAVEEGAVSAGAQPLVDLDSFAPTEFDHDRPARGDDGGSRLDTIRPEDSMGMRPTLDMQLPATARRPAPAPQSTGGVLTPTPLPTADAYPDQGPPNESQDLDVASYMGNRPPWLLIIIVLLLAGSIVAAIGLSGPTVEGTPAPNPVQPTGE